MCIRDRSPSGNDGRISDRFDLTGTNSNFVSTIPFVSTCSNFQSPTMELSTQQKVYQNDPIHLNIAPNPFTQETTIRYYLSQKKEIQLRIVDIAGTTIRVLDDGWKEAGWQEVIYQANQLPAGIYYLNLMTDNGQENKKIINIK